MLLKIHSRYKFLISKIDLLQLPIAEWKGALTTGKMAFENTQNKLRGS
jgi:hypothetical protein